MERVRELFIKYRELLSYLFFGVLTSVVNYVSYLLLAPFFGTTTIPSAMAWVLSVAFAYLTNRRWVFRSQAKGAAAVLREAGSFVGARLISGVIDVGIMWVFADRLGFNDKLAKLASNVFVVIFNYIASKLIIFRKK